MLPSLQLLLFGTLTAVTCVFASMGPDAQAGAAIVAVASFMTVAEAMQSFLFGTWRHVMSCGVLAVSQALSSSLFISSFHFILGASVQHIPTEGDLAQQACPQVLAPAAGR